MEHPNDREALKPTSILPGIETARVLVVDDNRVNLHLLTAVLERKGIKSVAVAQDGHEALATIKVFRPDLVLLDLMMPNLDGYEMCRRLREQPEFRDLPVLVQSSLNRAEDRARAFSAGATDYVSKPINAIELIARVRIHLHNQFLLRRLQGYRDRAEAELSLARRMQERLLPQPAQIASMETSCAIAIDAHFAPSSELGGDLWGAGAIGDGRVVVWLVDFSGHGVGAALNTFRLHAIMNQMGFHNFEPATFLAAVNRRLCPLLPVGQFATMLIGVIDPARGTFDYASGAATRPVVWAAGAPAIIGDSSGLPLGITQYATYETRHLPLPLGGQLFLYSDAAVEMANAAGELYEEDSFFEMVDQCRARTAGDALLPAIVAGLEARGKLNDDLTVVLMTRGA